MICRATNGKWVSRRLLTGGLGFNLIMVLLVRLFANKVNVKVRYFVKWAATAFNMQSFNFQAADVLVSFIFYFKAVCAENGVSGSLKPPKTSFGL